jgi:hypothetical protein
MGRVLSRDYEIMLRFICREVDATGTAGAGLPHEESYRTFDEASSLEQWLMESTLPENTYRTRSCIGVELIEHAQ